MDVLGLIRGDALFRDGIDDVHGRGIDSDGGGRGRLVEGSVVGLFGLRDVGGPIKSDE